MSTVKPTDKVLVNRAGTDYSAPADMSTVQDTDLLLINRAGVDYKCSFADWKNSQTKAPDVGTVTLSDVAGGDRFTSTAFPVSATMVEDGTPKSDKKLKAYVEGALKSAALSSAITLVGAETSHSLTGGTITANRAPTGDFGTNPDINTILNGLVSPIGNQCHFQRGALPDPLIFTVTPSTPIPPHSALSLVYSYGDVPTTVASKYGWTITEINGSPATLKSSDPIAHPTNGAVAVVADTGAAAISSFKISLLNDGANDWVVGGFDNSYQTPVLTLTDNTQLANFAPGDAVTEVGNGDDATGTVGAVDTTANTITLSASTGTWDVGSQVKGPLKTIIKKPESDEITAVNGLVLTLKTDKDLRDFANGDAVNQDSGAPLTDLTYSVGIGSGGRAGVADRTTQFNSTKKSVPLATGSFTEAAISGAIMLDLGSAASSIDYTFGAGSTIAGTWFAGDDLVNWVNTGITADAGLTRNLTGYRYWWYEVNTNNSSNTFTGTLIGEVSGTVGSVDTTANTITLSSSTGTWSANTGNWVIGPTKASSSVKLYCKLDAAGAVSDLQSADPGFTAWTPTGTGPYTGVVNFPATLPTGNPPDTDLPPGTQLTVEVEATNTAGTDSAASNTITPA